MNQTALKQVSKWLGSRKVERTSSCPFAIGIRLPSGKSSAIATRNGGRLHSANLCKDVLGDDLGGHCCDTSASDSCPCKIIGADNVSRRARYYVDIGSRLGMLEEFTIND